MSQFLHNDDKDDPKAIAIPWFSSESSRANNNNDTYAAANSNKSTACGCQRSNC